MSNVAQVTQVCKGEMAERRSEETILAEPLSYIDTNYSLLIIQVIKHTWYMTNKGICAVKERWQKNEEGWQNRAAV